MAKKPQPKKVRILRHWKQRFDKNAKFIWRKPLTWEGKKAVVGNPIPKSLSNAPTKLRRFWESGTIELAQFEEPKNIATGTNSPPNSWKDDTQEKLDEKKEKAAAVKAAKKEKADAKKAAAEAEKADEADQGEDLDDFLS